MDLDKDPYRKNLGLSILDGLIKVRVNNDPHKYQKPYGQYSSYGGYSSYEPYSSYGRPSLQSLLLGKGKIKETELYELLAQQLLY